MSDATQRRLRSEVAALNELLAVQERTVIEQSKRLELALATAQAAQLHAESADRTKSQFLATMSHELRTPLNAIIGFSKILKKNKSRNLSDKDINLVERVHENGTHLLHLINEVLDISKIEAGQMSYQRDACAIHNICETVVRMQESLARNKGITLKSEVPYDLAPFHADQHRLQQILINLVGNAIKFTEAGSVTIRATTHGDERSVRTIEVIDSGVGIKQVDLSSIFRAFEQVEGGANRTYSGTGLGLAISKALCEGMGLSLDVSSEFGSGSTFRISVPLSHSVEIEAASLPASQVEQASPDAPFVDEPTEGMRKRVLILDDNADARMLLSELVRDYGCEVRLARDGNECLRIARAWKPDLITLDLMMPTTNGWQILAKLRQTPGLAEIPVVVISMVANENRGTLADAVEILQKPIGHSDIARVLANIDCDSRRALIVEDNPDARVLLAEVLDELGWEVAEATNGAEGLAALTRYEPNVVFLDLMMPVMDGVEFLAKVRASPHRDLPVIVVSAKETTAEERAEILRNADSILEKGEALATDIGAVMERLFGLSRQSQNTA